MGYIAALGLGRPKNITLAHKLFNESLVKHPFMPGINADILLTLAQLYGDENPFMLK
jgi:hypothetical protein